jgi:threonine dehydrogenase-like Zn-dependent dehydrogenase
MVTGINCHAIEEGGSSPFDIAADLLLRKRISIDAIITHRFPMSSYREAIKTFFSKGEEKAIKIVLEHDG